MQKVQNNTAADTTPAQRAGVSARLSRTLASMGDVFGTAAERCYNGSQGQIRLHIGPLYIWTRPALERHAQAIHARALGGCPAPSYAKRESEAESALTQVGVLRLVN